MHRQATTNNYYESWYTDLPFSGYFGITNFDDLQRIADENNVTIDESIAFIRTLPIDIVQTYRQRLVEQPMFRDQWITLPVIFPSANGNAKTFRVLASIFENGIAGELSFTETGRNDRELNGITSTEPPIYDYVEVNTAANDTKGSLRRKLILTGVVVFCIIAIVTVVFLIKILSPTSNTITTTTAVPTTTITTTTTTITTTTTTTTTTTATTTSTTTTSTTTTTTTTTTTITTTTIPTIMTDCHDWLHINNATSNGTYRIDPGYGLEPFDVYCDMTTNGGGWTVIQRHVNDNSQMWKNTWNEYKVGFNNSIENGNLWLGNDRIHVMSRLNVILRVEINGDRTPNNTNPNVYLYGEYNFSISDEASNYTLYISYPIEGNASDNDPTYGFIYNNGMPFSTIDKESNQYGSECTNDHELGGWWFNGGCTDVALNGNYNAPQGYGFLWYNPATRSVVHPNRSEMKIRRQ